MAKQVEMLYALATSTIKELAQYAKHPSRTEVVSSGQRPRAEREARATEMELWRVGRRVSEGLQAAVVAPGTATRDLVQPWGLGALRRRVGGSQSSSRPFPGPPIP